MRFPEGGYLWFEEDCQEPVVLRELMDKKLWSPPSHVKDPDAFERDIDRNIQQYNPAYWQARERARSGHPGNRPFWAGPVVRHAETKPHVSVWMNEQEYQH